jgi:hypothetical protein
MAALDFAANFAGFTIGYAGVSWMVQRRVSWAFGLGLAAAYAAIRTVL